MRHKGLEVEGFIFLQNDFDSMTIILDSAENFEVIEIIDNFDLTESNCRRWIENKFIRSLELYRREAMKEVRQLTKDIKALKEVI